MRARWARSSDPSRPDPLVPTVVVVGIVDAVALCLRLDHGGRVPSPSPFDLDFVSDYESAVFWLTLTVRLDADLPFGGRPRTSRAEHKHQWDHNPQQHRPPLYTYSNCTSRLGSDAQHDVHPFGDGSAFYVWLAPHRSRAGRALGLSSHKPPFGCIGSNRRCSTCSSSRRRRSPNRRDADRRIALRRSPTRHPHIPAFSPLARA